MMNGSLAGNRNRLWDAFLIAGIPAFVILLAYQTKSFWGDEILSISCAMQPGFGTFKILAGDYHPPLYFFLLKFWIAIFGTGEAGLRAFQGAQGAFFLWISLQLFRKFIPERRYHPLWLLLVVSSELWLFMPMLRYYTLAASLVMGSTYLLWNWKENPTNENGVFLALSYIALLYTDYPSSMVIAFHLFYILFTQRRLVVRLLVPLAAAIAAFVPWVMVTLDQIHKLRALGQVADLNTSPFAVLLKCGYSLYAFLIGETIYPFEAVAVAGLILISVVGITAFFKARLFRDRLFLFSFGLAITGIIFTSVITTYISTHTSFIYTPSRTFFGLGFLFLAFGIIYDRMQNATMRYLLLGSLVVVAGYGDYNWAMNRHFLMPVYATPWKEVLGEMRDQDGLIFADEGLCYSYYQNHLQGTYPELQQFTSVSDLSEKVLEKLTEHPEGIAVYVLLQGRESTESQISPAVMAYLQGNATLEYAKKYLPIDETYRKIKSKILHRESYDAKVTLYKYILKDFSKNRYPLG
jgi:hypothetical protein